MTRVVVVAVVLASALIGTSCGLQPYGNGVVGCSVDGEACPAGFACLDPKDRKRGNICVQIGCGDGEVDLAGGERCDDANDNRLDLCVDCQTVSYQADPSTLLGFGVGGSAPLQTPIGRPAVVASDEDGNLFIGSIGTNTVTRLDRRDNKLTTFAGNGSLVSTNSAFATSPNEISTVFASSLAVDGLGNLYLSDLQNSVVRRIDRVTGDAVVVAGTGVRGVGIDGVIATQTPLDLPVGLAVNGNGTLFIAERASGGLPGRRDRVRRLDRNSGMLTTIIERVAEGAPGPAGSNSGVEQRLAGPVDLDVFVGITRVTLGSDDAVVDTTLLEILSHHLRVTDDVDGTIVTTPDQVLADGVPAQGRLVIETFMGGPPENATAINDAKTAPLLRPSGLAIDDTGRLLIADGSHRIRAVDVLTGAVTRSSARAPRASTATTCRRCKRS